MQQTVKFVTVETDLTLKFLPELHKHLIADIPSTEHWQLSLAYGAEVDSAGLQWLFWLQKSLSPSILTVKVSSQHSLIQLIQLYQITPPFKVQISG